MILIFPVTVTMRSGVELSVIVIVASDYKKNKQKQFYVIYDFGLL